MKRIIQKIVPFAGLVIVLWLFAQVDLGQVLELWLSSSKIWIVVAVLIMLVQLLILTLKWSILLQEKVSIWALFKVRMIGAFFGTITPANAGTLVRAHYLKKATKISLAKSGSSVILDKLLEVATIALLGVISIVGLSNVLINEQHNFVLLSLSVGGFTGAMLTTVWLMTDKTYGTNILRKTAKSLLPTKLYDLIKPYFLKLHPHLQSVDSLVAPFLLNIASYANSYVYVLALIWAIGADLSYFQIFLTLPLSSLVALLPITISGIGTREASTVFLWELFGVSAEQTLSVMLLSFVIGRGLPTLLGWYFLSTFREKK
jgi:uncharacterized protein (TIRG00374 family)